MNFKRVSVFLLCGIILWGFSTTAIADKKKKRSLEEQQAIGLIKTGLKPLYPTQDTCLEVSSPFASQTRYDGSERAYFSNYGYHGGMDISLKVGTPIVAVADGTVVQVATGGRLVGNKVTLRHTPQDTGFDMWTFSKYQHLDEPSKLEVGARVKKGDVIGLGGRTGTTGGHFGDAGYPHLHMNIYANHSGEYKEGKGHKLAILDMQYVDPLAIFFMKSLNSHVLREMPSEEKTFQITYMTTDGNVVPKDSRTVWPIRCTPGNHSSLQ